MMFSFFLGFAAFSFIVFFHELGHYLFARLFNVHVKSFSIGFGSKVLQYFGKNGTKWSFSLIPLGGYIEPLEKSVISKSDSGSDKLGMEDIHPFKGVLIAFAGPLFNFVLSFLILFSVFIYKGVPVKSNEVTYISKEFSQKYDINIGDTVKVEEDKDNIVIKVYKDGNVIEKKVAKEEFRLMRLSFIKYKKESLYISILQSFTVVYKSIKGFFENFANAIFSLKISSPIGMLKESSDIQKQGVFSFLIWLAMLSTMLGASNLLPIPALDGGQILIYLGKWVTGGSLSDKQKNALILISIMILFPLMFIAFISDLQRLNIFKVLKGLF